MVEQTNTNDAGALRQRLKQAGFCPLPLNGKAPSMKGWQTKLDANADEIRLWEKLYPYHTNTGVLTRLTPAIDIDLTHPEAAEAVEALAREHFEQRGYVMVRIGKAPKRAILLRTDEPFQKLTSTLTAQDGSTQKIEILADGQQLAVHGMHPETKRGYAWHGGEPWSITREELPYVCEQDARGFLADARKLLIEQFGFKQSERAKTDGDAQQANNQKGGHDPADWGALFARIRAGENLHDTIRDLAASFVVSGMTDKIAIEQIRGLMTASIIEKDARWRERYADIPRAVRSAREKFGQNQTKKDFFAFHWHGEVNPNESRTWLVQDLIPEVGSGLLSGQWGTYKTFTALDIAHAVMSGEPFLGFETIRRGGVLFIAQEGSSEVAIRLQGVIETKAKLQGRAPFAWIETCPPLVGNDAAETLSAMAAQIAARLRADFDLPLVMIVIDNIVVAAGYTKDGADNDATTVQVIMQTLADVARTAGCFVFGIDHFGKNATVGTRGSSVKEGNADVVLALLGDKGIAGEVLNTRLALRKRRSGPNGLEFPFKPRVVDMGADRRGAAVTTLVLDWGVTEAAPKAAKDDWGRGKGLKLLRRTIMTLMVDCGCELRPYADGPTVRALRTELVRAEFCKNHYVTGETEKAKRDARSLAFRRAVADAADKGLITTREVGGEDFVWLASTPTGYA